MITTGQSITNSVTGETLVFRTTSADANGECVVVETYVEPNGAVAAAHVHPSQEETFEVIAGELEFRLGKRKLVAGPGDRVLVPAGTHAPLPQRRRGDGALRLRGQACARLRAADRDDVLPRRGREGQQEGHAEPAAPRGHRQAPLRRRPAPVPARVAPARRPRDGRASRPRTRFPGDLRAAGAQGADRASASRADACTRRPETRPLSARLPRPERGRGCSEGVPQEPQEVGRRHCLDVLAAPTTPLEACDGTG